MENTSIPGDGKTNDYDSKIVGTVPNDYYHDLRVNAAVEEMEESAKQDAAPDFSIEAIYLARQAATQASQEAVVVASGTGQSSRTYGKKVTKELPVDVNMDMDVDTNSGFAQEAVPAVSVDNAALLSQVHTHSSDVDMDVDEDILETMKYITSPVKLVPAVHASPAQMAPPSGGRGSATKHQIDDILFSPEASKATSSAAESPNLLDSILKSSGGSKASRESDINDELFGEVTKNLSQSIFEDADSDEEVDFGTAQQLLSQYDEGDENEIDVAGVFDRAGAASARSSATTSPAKAKGRTAVLEESDDDGNNSRDYPSEGTDNDEAASPQREQNAASSKKERQTAVEKEIETIRALQAGPTEDDLKRLKLIEVDEEEVEEHILREQTLALRGLTSVIDKISVREQNKQFHETRRWLVMNLRSSSWLREAVEPEFTVNRETRKIGKFAEIAKKWLHHKGEVFKFDLLNDPNDQRRASEYFAPEELDEDDEGYVFDDDKDGAVDESIRADTTTDSAVNDNTDLMVLSDDSGGEEEEEEVVVKTEEEEVVVKAEPRGVKEEVKAEPRLAPRRYLSSIKPHVDPRVALKKALSRKASKLAREGYQKMQRCANPAQLKLKVETIEKLRLLERLGAEREERRSQIDQLHKERHADELRLKSLVNRQRLRAASGNDDEEEFDENDEDLNAPIDLEEYLRMQQEQEDEEYFSEEEEEEVEDIDEIIRRDEEEALRKAALAEAQEGDDDFITDEEVPADDAAVRSVDVIAGELNGRYAKSTSSRRHVDESAFDRLVGGEEGEEEGEVVRPARAPRKVVFNEDEEDSGAVQSRPDAASEVDDGGGAMADSGDEGDADTTDGGDADESARKARRREEREARKKSKVKNSAYVQALLDEERRAKAEKARGHNAFVDDEAEEEEEEGVQRGLGDFGFGVPAGYKDKKEEEDALQITKADLEGIVDDVSDDEGDEEAGLKARLEMDEKEDKARDKSIIKAITEGHDGKHKKKNDLEYERLLGSEQSKALARLEGEAAAEDEEDMEELLQRGMKDRFEREREANRRSALRDSDDEDDAGDEDEEELDVDGMTEEERRTEEERHKRLREQKEKERLRRREFEQSTQMRRHLRRQQGAGTAPKAMPTLSLSLDGFDMDIDEDENKGANLALSSKTNGSPRPAIGAGLSPRAASSSSTPRAVPMDNTNSFGTSNMGGASNSGSVKRRTQMQPVKSSANPLVRKKSVGEGSSKPSNSMYKASLGQAEVQEGMGLGMGASRNTSFMSAVTGSVVKRSSSFAAAAGVTGGLLDSTGRQRSYSKSNKRHKNNSGGSSVTVAANQFVFINGDESQAATATANSNWGDSKAASNTGTFQGGSKSQGGTDSQGGSASLFKAVFSRSSNNSLQNKPNSTVHAR